MGNPSEPPAANPVERQLLDAWAAAQAARDAGRLAGLYSPDAINHLGALGLPAQGRERIRADYAAFFRATPDAWFQAGRCFASGRWSVLEWTAGGTYAGDEYWEAGPFEVRGCGFFRIEGGLIRCQRGWYEQYTRLAA